MKEPPSLPQKLGNCFQQQLVCFKFSALMHLFINDLYSNLWQMFFFFSLHISAEFVSYLCLHLCQASLKKQDRCTVFLTQSLSHLQFLLLLPHAEWQNQWLTCPKLQWRWREKGVLVGKGKLNKQKEKGNTIESDSWQWSILLYCNSLQ